MPFYPTARVAIWADRIELELPLTQRLESIDAAHPETVALLA
jgi:hypothetical protein